MLAVVLDETKLCGSRQCWLWTKSLSAAVIGSPGQLLSAAVRCCALVTIAVLPLSGAVGEAVRETSVKRVAQFEAL